MAPLVCCTPVLALHVVGVSHLILVEWAMTDVALEGPREIHLFVQRHHQAIIVEEVVHASPIQVQHLAHESVHKVRTGVRLVGFVREYGNISIQLVPNRAGDVVGVERRLAPFSSCGIHNASQSALITNGIPC